jgi:hypothetical protein
MALRLDPPAAVYPLCASGACDLGQDPVVLADHLLPLKVRRQIPAAALAKRGTLARRLRGEAANRGGEDVGISRGDDRTGGRLSY